MTDSHRSFRRAAEAGPLVASLAGLALFLLLLFPLDLAAQGAGLITGRVVIEASGAPLAGAVVSLKDTPHRALTREDGTYALRAPAGAHTIEATHIGYKHDPVAVQVTADGGATVHFRMADSYIKLDEIVVTAGFEGRARSLNEMSAAVGIKNVVFEQQFQRMPDVTVADAVSRVPGMASTFDYNTGYLGYEGAVPQTSEISLRGLSPGMLSVMIDGQRLPSTSSEGRAVDLAGLSLQTIQSLEVMKAITPDVDADAAAGAINLRSRPPTDFHASASVAGGYNSLVSTSDYRANLNVGDRIGRFGFLLSGAYSRMRPGTDIVSNSWDDRDFGNGPEMVVNRFTVTTSQADRIRSSLNATLSWEFSGRSQLNFRGAFSDYSDDVSTQFLQLRPGKFLSLTETENGRIHRRGLFTDSRTRTVSGMLSGNHPLGGAQLNYGGGLSRSEVKLPEYMLIESRMDGVNLRYDRSDPVYTRYQVTSNHDIFAPDQFMVVSTQRRDDFTYDEDRSLFFDLTLPAKTVGTAAVTVKAGAKYADRERDRDFLRYFPAPGTPLWMTEVVTDGEHRTISPADYRLGQTVDRQRARAFLDKYQDSFGTTIDVSSSDAGEHTAQERIVATYAMATAEIGALTIVGGGRLETTRNRYVGKATVFGPDGAYVGTRDLASRSNNTGFFPGAHLRYELTPRNVARFAWTNTIARPAFNELAPTENISYESGRVSRGNPDLRPTRALNFDAQYDWYAPLGDHVSVSAYYKKLTDFTGQKTSTLVGGELDGFELVQWENFGDATTYGVETSVYKRLGFLPGPLRSLGINANYTWAGSETDFTEGRDLPLPNQSPHTMNIGLDYDYGPFKSSIAAQYQSDRLRHIGKDERYDMYLHRAVTLDLSATLAVRGGSELFAQVSDLTGAPTYLYAGGDKNYPQRASFSKPIWMFGLRHTF